MTARGLSIVFALNGVNPAAWGGWPGTLSNPANDGGVLDRIAKGAGFTSRTLLLNERATAFAFREGLRQLARDAVAGDLVLIGYSGHGGQVRDETGAEPSGFNSFLVLHDGPVVDDEVAELLAGFAAGVRVIVYVDACHSRGMTRALRDFVGSPAARAMPKTAAEEAWAQTPAWTAQRDAVRARPIVKPVASIIELSACAEAQEASDGAGSNGAFTEAMLAELPNAENLRHLVALARARLPRSQVPGFDSKVGTHDPAFIHQRPFTVAPPT